jgi:hypothetical protein
VFAYVNSSGALCTRCPAARRAKGVQQNGAMGALTFQSTTVGCARITVVFNTGIEPPYGWRSFLAARLPEAWASASHM